MVGGDCEFHMGNYWALLTTFRHLNVSGKIAYSFKIKNPIYYQSLVAAIKTTQVFSNKYLVTHVY